MLNPVPGPESPRRHQMHDLQLRRRADELEGVFLSEMLRHAGVGTTPKDFGGGIGEDQFGSFLRDAQARAIVAKGGLGLAAQIYANLKERTDDRD